MPYKDKQNITTGMVQEKKKVSLAHQPGETAQ